MPAFPTLSRGVEFVGFSDKISEAPTMRTEQANGLVKTRPRFTATKEEFHFGYRWLTAADVVLLKTFQKTTVVVGSESFTWTNPDDSTVYTVRMMNVIKFNVEPENFSLHSARLDFVEA